MTSPALWFHEPPLGVGSAPVQSLEARAYRIPTDRPESDGTLRWDATTMVVVHVTAGGQRGIGYSYTDAAAAAIARDLLAKVIAGANALDIPAAWLRMVRAVRNIGRPGVAGTAISAVDAALWDLKGRILQLPVALLLGRARTDVKVYGSGGFTSYTIPELEQQLGGWADAGIKAVKMKVGRDAGADVTRVQAARAAIGPDTELFVDANGAYDRKQALSQAYAFANAGVNWFEEPVSSNDLRGLRLLRDRVVPGMEISAGEYGYDIDYFRQMLDAGAVDVLQADATRCGGITEFLKVGALCSAFELPLSSHTAPSLHLHPCCAVGAVRHMEYFHDHMRIEHLLLDGARTPEEGRLSPDLSRPGLGIELKEADAQRYAV